jgi:NADH-quinone oxidoreductase subunit A
MILHTYSLVGLLGLIVLGVALLMAAVWTPDIRAIQTPDAWKNYRFGFATIALIFVAFDMEMIFMYPWAVVFAKTGLKAFLDMFVFIGLLSAGIAYAWGMGGLEWE